MVKTKILRFSYKKLLRPILFKLNPEKVHVCFTSIGYQLGKHNVTRKIVRNAFCYRNDMLSQMIEGVKFSNPIGLAAGFDYEANLGRIASDIGFGYATIGTVTNMPYEGNPKPRLKRLKKSKALLVNKGFKSPGADAIVDKIKDEKYDIPIGISIGRTNSAKLKTIGQSIDDIVQSFRKFEEAHINNSYYEVNISCPNLIHSAQNLNFYDPKRLKLLLDEIMLLKIKKTIFMKMPITLDEDTTKLLLKEILDHNIKTVIYGNLESNRNNPAVKEKIPSSLMGNISGKPTFQVSNKFIKLAYENFGNELKIIGCGGVFSAEDAYTKIKLGASLIQLITGMIYEGPQLIGQINYDLSKLLKNDGFDHLSQAIGVDVKQI